MLGATRAMDRVTERCMMNTQVLGPKPTDRLSTGESVLTRCTWVSKS